MSESVAKAAYQQANRNKEDISGLAGDGRTPEQTLKGAYEAIENKVDKVQGKGLSTNDYSNEEKQKVADNGSSIAHLMQQSTDLDKLRALKSVREIIDLPMIKNKYVPDPPLLFGQPNALTEVGFYTADKVIVDTENTFQQNPTLKITPAGTASYVRLDLPEDTDLSAYDKIEAFFKIKGLADLQSSDFHIEVSNHLNFEDRLRFYCLNRIKATYTDGWVRLVASLSDFTYSGSTAGTVSAWTNVRYLRIAFNGAATTLNIGKVEAIKPPTKANIYLYYDDGAATQYTNAFRIANGLGLKGCIAPVISDINGAGKVTLTQLKEIDAADWIIAGHGWTHSNLTELTVAQQREQFSKATDYLHKNGFSLGGYCWVAVGGGWNAEIARVAKSYLRLCRGGGYSRGGHSGQFQYNPMVQYYFSPKATDSVETIKGWIDEAITNKAEMAIAWHGIEGTEYISDYIYPLPGYEEVIQYIKDKKDAGDCNVVTWKDTMF